MFSQFGEPVHVNLIRDKDTGKSKGFAFLKYEDQRSTTLAVDNLGGANILGRTIRVDHTRYKPKEGDGTEEIGTDARADDDNGERDTKRRKRSESAERSPTPELLPEEVELQKLIRDHDDDDPMKDWLVREKRKEVGAARKKRDRALFKHKKRGDEGKVRSKHKSHQHRNRSRSKEHKTRRRSRSREGKRHSSPREDVNRHHRSEKDREHRDMNQKGGGREMHRVKEKDRDSTAKGDRNRERWREHGESPFRDRIRRKRDYSR
jgi:RNA-binding motif X-linked protein 2